MRIDRFEKKAVIIFISVVLSVVIAAMAGISVIHLVRRARNKDALLPQTSSQEVTVKPVSSQESSEQIETDNGIKLSIVNPSGTNVVTTQSPFTFSGTSDANAPLTVNGQEVPRGENGIFSLEFNLNVGKNTFTFVHKDQTVTYNIKYRYVVIESYSPNNKQIFSSGSTFTVTASARKGSSVSATFNGVTVQLAEQTKDTADNLAFATFLGSFTLPQNNNYYDMDLGKIQFTGSYAGVTENFNSGNIICKKPDFVVEYDPNATPLGGRYVNVGKGKITEIIAHEAETFDAYSTNDWSKTVNNYLPKGTVDYSALEYVYYNGAQTMEYAVLRCGRQVYTKKNDIPKAKNVPVVKEYAGILPEYNQVEIAGLEDEGGHTVLSLDCAWKAPFYFDILPQAYNDGDRYYNIESPTYNYIDITFCYSNQLSGEIAIPENNPIFSSAKIIQNQSDYTLRLYLKKQGGFYGWTCYYDDEASKDGKSRLCFEFLNPLQTVAAENNYGISLSGAKILLDVGHGGSDPGAVSFSNIHTEAARNLILANYIKAELESLGATVYMNRTDNSVSSAEDKLQLIKKLKPDLCIAIHHNSANTSKANGFDTRYYTPFSKKAAEFIYNHTYNTGIYSGASHNNFGWHYYFMARNTTCPVVLTENGYMSNKKDYDNILDENKNLLKAQAIVKGVAEYFTYIRN